jgi:PAS domain S-box-containing protein
LTPRILEGSTDIIGLTVSSHNITERKKVDQKLLASEKFLNAAFENIPNMIFIKDAKDLRFVRINKAGEDLLGYSREELIGKSDYDFFPKEEADFFINKDKEVLENGTMVDILEEPIKTGGKGERKLHTKKIPLQDNNGIPEYLLGISEDITEQKKAENLIKASLKEKETLLQEIHHRVKNNMQVISSLLDLQSSTAKDPKIKDALKESQSRVHTMSAVHQTLHESDKLSEIDLQTYLDKVTTSIFQTYSVEPGKVSLINKVENIPISMSQASPLGLIINELISNSLKYAFPDDRKGEITVSMKKIHTFSFYCIFLKLN